MSMSTTQTATAYDQRPDTRPRSKSHLSFKSERSHKSSNSIDRKQKLTESPREKRKSSFTKTGKANPNAAINEAQPIALALEKPTIASLRGSSYKDAAGNLITDPDLSNPTRPRWERPLDTIKSFDDAIDKEYRRRSMVRNDSAPEGLSDMQSRRSSYFGGNGYDNGRGGSQVGGYYGNRSAVGRDRENMMGNSYGGPPIANPSRNRYGQRMHADPVVPRHNHEGAPIYPSHGYQQSRDTVYTGGSGSGSEPWANGTDPSSEDSSIDRPTPGDRPDPREHYGFNGFGNRIPEDRMAEPPYQNRRPEDGQYGPPPPQHRQPYGNGPPPAPPKQSFGGAPAQNGANQFGPPLNSTISNSQRPNSLTKNTSNTSNGDKGEKRKSWFKRKFSKD